MTITREDMIKLLSEKSGYYQKDVRELLHCMDEVVFEELNKATLEDEVSIQMMAGLRIGCKIIPERERRSPIDQSAIIVAEGPQTFAKFSQAYKQKLIEAYNEKNEENG